MLETWRDATIGGKDYKNAYKGVNRKEWKKPLSLVCNRNSLDIEVKWIILKFLSTFYRHYSVSKIRANGIYCLFVFISKYIVNMHSLPFPSILRSVFSSFAGWQMVGGDGEFARKKVDMPRSRCKKWFKDVWRFDLYMNFGEY